MGATPSLKKSQNDAMHAAQNMKGSHLTPDQARWDILSQFTLTLPIKCGQKNEPNLFADDTNLT